MLEMRPSCECCDTDLPADAGGAAICSFECTWCSACADECLGGTCPNCGGGFEARPRRSGYALAANPASTVRVHQPGLHQPGLHRPARSTDVEFSSLQRGGLPAGPTG